jgi:hypothetical protein
MEKQPPGPSLDEIAEKLDAIIAVLALGVPEQDSKGRKIEQTLSNCGLSYNCIARILGKKEDAVRMSLSRARSK